jgi:hypothetical protein
MEYYRAWLAAGRCCKTNVGDLRYTSISLSHVLSPWFGVRALRSSISDRGARFSARAFYYDELAI